MLRPGVRSAGVGSCDAVSSIFFFRPQGLGHTVLGQNKRAYSGGALSSEPWGILNPMAVRNKSAELSAMTTGAERIGAARFQDKMGSGAPSTLSVWSGTQPSFTRPVRFLVDLLLNPLTR